MNVQMLFEAAKNDEMNSALGVIVSELEKQGYRVLAENKEVSAVSIFDGEQEDLENRSSINLKLYKGDDIVQSFVVEFLEYHEFIIKKDN